MDIKTKIYTELFKNSFNLPIKIIFWNGKEEILGDSEPEITIKINEPIDWKYLKQDASIALAEAYMDKKIEVEGSFKKLMLYAFNSENSFMENKSFRDLKKVDKYRLRDNLSDIQHHYDIGNKFYKYWLDDSMTYSCAYFKDVNDSLEKAQKQKIDHTLKKLRLKPNDHLFDIGCGWGDLIITAAKEYGVKAVGCTLSHEQYLFVKERIEEENLSNQVKVNLADYEQAIKSGAKFDKIVSIGMFEHVGRMGIPKYIKNINLLLKDNSLALLHGISGQRDFSDNTKGSNGFLNKYIFPGGYIPSVAELIIPINIENLHIIDLESLRFHYKLTLDEWYNRFNKNIDKILEVHGERFVRMWQIYLQSCSAIFESGKLDVCQYLIEKGTDNTRPLTREYML